MVARHGTKRKEGQGRQSQRRAALERRDESLDVLAPGRGNESIAKGTATHGEDGTTSRGAKGTDNRQRHDREPVIEVEVGQHGPCRWHEGGYRIERDGQCPHHEPVHGSGDPASTSPSPTGQSRGRCAVYLGP